jgi:queuine/archaeosine tRNA-ribosyltransferase
LTKRSNTKRPVDTDPRYYTLTPQARTVLKHLSNVGTITGREALLDHSVQSLTRRITEIRDAGYNISAQWRKHPLTGQRYTRYSFAG